VKQLVGLLLTAVLAGGAVAGCATGKDAVAQGGTFDFVSPGGKTDIVYDPPGSRGAIGPMSGPSVTDAGKTVSVADYAGQVVVLNIWGQWCGPCRGEAADLERVYQQTKDSGVAFVGIDVRDFERESASDFLVDRKVTYPSIYDPSMRDLAALGEKFPTSVIPTTLILDRRHRVAEVFLRSLVATDLAPAVLAIAAEKS